MPTTLNIGEDVVAVARQLAAGEHRSLGSVIPELARLVTFDSGIRAMSDGNDVEVLTAL